MTVLQCDIPESSEVYSFDAWQTFVNQTTMTVQESTEFCTVVTDLTPTDPLVTELPAWIDLQTNTTVASPTVDDAFGVYSFDFTQTILTDPIVTVSNLVEINVRHCEFAFNAEQNVLQVTAGTTETLSPTLELSNDFCTVTNVFATTDGLPVPNYVVWNQDDGSITVTPPAGQADKTIEFVITQQFVQNLQLTHVYVSVEVLADFAFVPIFVIPPLIPRTQDLEFTLYDVATGLDVIEVAAATAQLGECGAFTTFTQSGLVFVT